MLYEEKITYQHTDRMKVLVSGAETPTEQEILELWRIYKKGSEYVGPEEAPSTLVEFGMWLAGTAPFENPAEIIW